MRHRLHTTIPVRWSTICEHRRFPTQINSRFGNSSDALYLRRTVWCCRNSYGDQTEMEQVGVCASNSFPDVVMGDPESLEKKIAAIRAAGPQKLQVIADFDGTLTKYWIDGHRGQSSVLPNKSVGSHGLLQQENSKYDVKRRELAEYYHPLEFNPTIPLDEKAKLMEEWWEKTHALLIEGGLTYDAIKSSVANATIAFREGVVELFEFLEICHWWEIDLSLPWSPFLWNYKTLPCKAAFPGFSKFDYKFSLIFLCCCNLQEREVPVLIFSAGLADIIEEVLRQKLHRSFKNVKIVSNRMVFNLSGQLVSFKGKTIHVLNKNEHALDMAAPVHDHLGDTNGPVDDNASVKKRTSVLLLGDHIGDLRMSDGLNYETRISVGFLNHNVADSLESYRKAFDVVYLNDAPMRGVVNLVSQLCST
ncbi:hypothetical protein RHSIM_RhsimUnG0215000 [Rhododendron simsii]|uniref:5'-nucleotidase n=1 Tax=Rhododendron simsii TaxID=118357 RepID=A0A834L3W9_RHOSS|nr:hypothetical protein RHSIM_RhsimUnG0215000 [Rhododendron simsii]